jgi:hypothetical protein
MPFEDVPTNVTLDIPETVKILGGNYLHLPGLLLNNISLPSLDLDHPWLGNVEKACHVREQHQRQQQQTRDDVYDEARIEWRIINMIRASHPIFGLEETSIGTGLISSGVITEKGERVLWPTTCRPTN